MKVMVDREESCLRWGCPVLAMPCAAWNRRLSRSTVFWCLFRLKVVLRKEKETVTALRAHWAHVTKTACHVIQWLSKPASQAALSLVVQLPLSDQFTRFPRYVGLVLFLLPCCFVVILCSRQGGCLSFYFAYNSLLVPLAIVLTDL